jgi:hypothetical protein
MTSCGTFRGLFELLFALKYHIFAIFKILFAAPTKSRMVRTNQSSDQLMKKRRFCLSFRRSSYIGLPQASTTTSTTTTTSTARHYYHLNTLPTTTTTTIVPGEPEPTEAPSQVIDKFPGVRKYKSKALKRGQICSWHWPF